MRIAQSAVLRKGFKQTFRVQTFWATVSVPSSLTSTSNNSRQFLVCFEVSWHFTYWLLSLSLRAFLSNERSVFKQMILIGRFLSKIQFQTHQENSTRNFRIFQMEALILFGLAENIFAYLSMSDMDLNEIFGLSKSLFSKTLDHGAESPQRNRGQLPKVKLEEDLPRHKR